MVGEIDDAWLDCTSKPSKWTELMASVIGTKLKDVIPERFQERRRPTPVFHAMSRSAGSMTTGSREWIATDARGSRHDAHRLDLLAARPHQIS